jgi:RNA polymerase primary sigma factor
LDLSKYYTEICKTTLLTREEEYDLLLTFYSETSLEKEKEEARSIILKSNLRYVFNMARKYSKNDPDTFPDLIAAGNIGLLVGFNKYKPNKGTRVLSYAHFWIYQAMMEQMSKMRLVSLPVYKQQLSSKIQKMKGNNEALTMEELKKEFEGTGVSAKDIEDLYETKYLTFYITDLDESNFEINPIEDQVQRLLDDEKCLSTVNLLPSPYREIIGRCFGLADSKEQSISKISRDLKLSKEDVQLYKEKGLKMLKELLTPS